MAVVTVDGMVANDHMLQPRINPAMTRRSPAMIITMLLQPQPG